MHRRGSSRGKGEEGMSKPILDPIVARLTHCPKTMTNGPCGGVGLDASCEVDRAQICVWHEYFSVGAQELPAGRKAAIDWSAPAGGWEAALTQPVVAGAATEAAAGERPMRAGSRLERLLRQGEFVVSCELNPHDSADLAPMLRYAADLAPYIDAGHISDNSLASPHMCGLAVAAAVQQVGIEPILHVTCRDRNRLMLQADVLGAHALGVRNILCITGDHPALGDHAPAKPVFDLDSVTLIDMVRRMRDEGRFIHGDRTITPRPALLIGGAVAATAPPFEYRVARLAGKADAGIDFAVTQLVFDMEMLRSFLARFHDAGLAGRVHLLVGVGALHSPNQCRYINGNTPGVVIPDWLIRRLEGVLPSQRRAEGVKIVVEQIQELRELPGVAGIDIMDLDPRNWFPTMEIVEAAGLLPRPPLDEEEPQLPLLG